MQYIIFSINFTQKDTIEDMVKAGVKPLVVEVGLKMDPHIPSASQPTAEQIRSLIYNKNTKDKAAFTLNDMRTYIHNNIVSGPNDVKYAGLGDNDVFVISYHEGTIY